MFFILFAGFGNDDWDKEYDKRCKEEKIDLNGPDGYFLAEVPFVASKENK